MKLKKQIGSSLIRGCWITTPPLKASRVAGGRSSWKEQFCDGSPSTHPLPALCLEPRCLPTLALRDPSGNGGSRDTAQAFG